MDHILLMKIGKLYRIQAIFLIFLRQYLLQIVCYIAEEIKIQSSLISWKTTTSELYTPDHLLLDSAHIL